MPDLGPYATYVLGAYAAGIGILAALVLSSLRSAARARKELDALEARRAPRRI